MSENISKNTDGSSLEAVIFVTFVTKGNRSSNRLTPTTYHLKNKSRIIYQSFDF